MKEFTKYCTASTIFFLLTILTYNVFTDKLKIAATTITIIWFPTCFMLRYAINKTWVFKKPSLLKNKPE